MTLAAFWLCVISSTLLGVMPIPIDATLLRPPVELAPAASMDIFRFIDI
jgi:hypothetical protein